jgi:hypothetical protein
MTMSNHQEFMDSRMLHAFMDGELGSPQEEALFQRLSADSALRSEMQDHLAIRKAIQHDIEAFTPPASATAAIFSTLGFTIPSVTASAASAGAAAGTAAGASMLRSVWLSAASSMLALTAAVLLYLQFPVLFDAVGSTIERVVSAPTDIVVIEEAAPIADLPVAPVHRGASTIATPAGVAAPTLRDITPRDMELLAGMRSDPEVRGKVRADQLRLYDLLPAPDGVTLYARNVALRSDPAPTVISQSEPWFRNVNLGVLYALDDHHAIGIEGGRESFSQHFTGMENGVGVRFEQNPLAYWATAVYQFTGDPLLPHVHPFAQLQAGGAFELGALGRVAVGLKFKPFDRIAVVVGAEGNLLLYRFQNNWFSTNKVGMTYGFSYEF